MKLKLLHNTDKNLSHIIFTKSTFPMFQIILLSKKRMFIIISLTCFNAANKAMHLALEPQIMPSAYCKPSLRIAGCIIPAENLICKK